MQSRHGPHVDAAERAGPCVDDGELAVQRHDYRRDETWHPRGQATSRNPSLQT